MYTDIKQDRKERAIKFWKLKKILGDKWGQEARDYAKKWIIPPRNISQEMVALGQVRAGEHMAKGLIQIDREGVIIGLSTDGEWVPLGPADLDGTWLYIADTPRQDWFN